MFTIQQIRSFNQMDMDLYDYIMCHKDKVTYMTIRELAAEVQTSTTSILRFCLKVGCDGFMEFKVRFKQYIENEKVKVSYADDKVSIFEDFLAKVKTPAFKERVEKAVKLLKLSEKLFCIGVGPTGSIAYYAASYFSAVGYFSVYLDNNFFSKARRLSDDSYMIFCVSGESKEIEQVMRRIKDDGGRTILITNSVNCTLAKLADAVIPYNLYYAKSVQENVLQKHDSTNEVLDILSTQLPTVYVIELIAKALEEQRHDFAAGRK